MVVASPEVEEAQANAAPNVETISTAAVERPKVRGLSGAAVGKQASVALVAEEEPDW